MVYLVQRQANKPRSHRRGMNLTTPTILLRDNRMHYHSRVPATVGIIAPPAKPVAAQQLPQVILAPAACQLQLFRTCSARHRHDSRANANHTSHRSVCLARPIPLPVIGTYRVPGWAVLVTPSAGIKLSEPEAVASTTHPKMCGIKCRYGSGSWSDR